MSMKRSFGLLLLLCVLALPSFANLITNGDFETPVVPVGGFFNYNTGSTLITGWTVVGRQVSIVSGSYFSNGANFPAQNGVQWLDLTGDLSNSLGEGVEQSGSHYRGSHLPTGLLRGKRVGSRVWRG